MNAAHFHLLLNHIPILGTIFGVVLLAYGFFRRYDEVQKASLGLLAVAGLTAIAVYLTGEGAEEAVEDLAGVTHDLIESHEGAGKVALISGIATGVVSLLGLVVAAMRQQVIRWTVILTLIVGLATSGIMGWTAYLGGQINHPEIRSTTAASSSTAVPETESENEYEE